MRLFFSVLTGYLFFAICSALLFQFWGRDPHAPVDLAFGLASTGCGVLFALAGGYWAVKCSQRDSLAAGLWVGGLIGAGAMASLIADFHGAIWSQLAAMLLMAPAACAGGWLNLRKRHLNTNATAQDLASSR
jgi:hypothetical protein